jgi:SEC-C motif
MNSRNGEMDMMPPLLPDELNALVDPDGGFLCLTCHWRPKLGAPDPEMPGEKLSMSSYIPSSPTDACLCGSGMPYSRCCRPKPDWEPVCPDPGGQGYSLVKPQAATFRGVDGTAIRARLAADVRFRCVDDSRKSSFWIFWGDPPVEEPYGILCFGDVELKDNRTLVLSAMSDLRMQTLLGALAEIAGDTLGSPRMQRDRVPVIHKQDRPSRALTHRGRPGRKHRRR